MTHLARPAAAVLLAAAAFAAGPPPAAVDARAVPKLVERLGDRDPRARDLAQRRLAAFGPAVLPWLYPAVTNPDPEVRRRALRLIGPLERERDLRPRRFTGSFRDELVTKVLAEVRDQTGYRARIVDGPELGFAPLKLKAAPRFTGSFVDATFWEVMQRLCDDCRFRLVDGGTQGQVAEVFLVPVKRPSAFVTTDGAFRVTAQRIEQQRGLELDQDDTPDPLPDVLVTLTAQCEPRFKFVAHGEPRLESAYDDRGNSLLPPRGRAMEGGDEKQGVLVVEGPVRGGGHTVGFQVSLVRPSAEATRVRLLKGVLPATVIIGHKSSVVIDRLPAGKGKTFKLGEASLRVEQVRKLARGRVEVKLRPLPGPIGPMGVVDNGEDAAVELLQQRVEFRDDAGNPCKHTIDGGEENLLVLRVAPSRRGRRPAVQLVLREPVLRQVDVPFTCRNLPLP